MPYNTQTINGNTSDEAIKVKTKALIFNDQGGLCAFCESTIQENEKQRVEHFHPKSGTQNHNWALDWANVMGVCFGGSDVDKSIHPLPANLSCDAYKDHLITKKQLPCDCEGYLLNPLKIPAFPCLFDFDKRTGALKAKKDYGQLQIGENTYASVSELVEKTIETLNLNCDRLMKDRLAVLYQYNQTIKKAREHDDHDVFSKLAERWLQKKWLSFFTTRRVLLGEHAEKLLKNQKFQG
ncbi:MAG: retron system putative HNH endonuclease [Methylococcales bacterium]